MARRLPPCHCPEWLTTVEDIGQIYGWWLGEVELTFDPLSTLPLSVYPWREAPTMPLPRVAGDCKIYGRWLGEVELTFDPLSTLPLSVYPWRDLVRISMARRLPPCHCPEWLATVEDIGQIYGWWLGEVELRFDPLSTLAVSVYPWREAPAMPQSGWRLWRI